MKLRKNQKKNRDQSTSIETSMDNSASFPKMQPTSSLPIALILKCSEISIRKFKQAYCLDDLSVLIIKGNPTHDQLTEAWNKILSEYALSIQSEDSEYMVGLERDIILLQHHIIYVEEAVKYLRRRYDEEMVNELINMG